MLTFIVGVIVGFVIAAIAIGSLVVAEMNQMGPWW